MKKTLLKFAAFSVTAIAIVATPAVSRAADDTNTMASASTNAAAADVATPNKFYGNVTAVDASAKTFTVSDQTYTVTGESQLTKDGKPATLADAVVGEPARGSFVKGKDGKLEITKVRFGKAGGKAGGGKGGGKAGGKKKKDATGDTTAPAAPQN